MYRRFLIAAALAPLFVGCGPKSETNESLDLAVATCIAELTACEDWTPPSPRGPTGEPCEPGHTYVSRGSPDEWVCPTAPTKSPCQEKTEMCVRMLEAATAKDVGQ
jgi:hypothetical protein